MDTFLYRYKESADYYNTVRFHCIEYKVIKHTPKGKWIDVWYGKKKFVLNNAKKKFAHETKEEAFDYLIKRKEKQVWILRQKLNFAELALNYAKYEKNKIQNLG